MTGWIKLHRKLKDHWLWVDAQKLKWWIDILIEANHDNAKVMIGATLIDCKRGQTVRSLESWAKDWRTSKKTVQRFLQTLQREGMIRLENVQITTRLTVCKYEDYQETRHAKETTATREGNAKETGATHKQEGLRSKEGERNNIDDLPFQAFYDLYNYKVGRKDAEKAWKKLSNEEREASMAALPAYKAKNAAKSKDFWKHPATWLNGRHWEDELPGQETGDRCPLGNVIDRVQYPEWNPNYPFTASNITRFKNNWPLKQDNS